MRKPAKKETRVSSFIKSLTKKADERIKPVVTFASKLDRKSRLYTAILILAGILLLVTSAYGGRYASDDYSTNSNAHMLTQLFAGNTHYPAVLPGPHATLLIIPLVYVQGHLPYHYTSFTLVNTALVVTTMLAWAYLLIRIFGRKYEVPILVILSSLIFTSVAFSLSLAYTTIRNIEYPLVLWFIMIVASVLKGRTLSRRQFVGAAIGTVLFIITLAGDSFFNYAILLPLLVVIAWYWIQSQELTAKMVKALGLIVGSFAGAVLLKFVLSAGGIITFDYGFWGPQTILPTARLWPSLGVALTETLEMHGANIFGQVIYYHNLALFVNFSLLLIGVGSLISILLKANRNYRNKSGLTDESSFAIVVMAISFFVTFLMYTVSGYAIATLPSGQIVSARNARYISLLPLITVIGLVWLIKNYYSKHIVFMCLLCTVLVAGIFTSYPSVSNAYKFQTKQLELAPSRDSVLQITHFLDQHDATHVLTDYWYGPVLGFWSKKPLVIAPQVGCNASTLSNPSNRLFTKAPGPNRAIIIDRGLQNYGFWVCTDAELLEFYGTPTEKLEVAGAGANDPVKVWVYKNVQ